MPDASPEPHQDQGHQTSTSPPKSNDESTNTLKRTIAAEDDNTVGNKKPRLAENADAEPEPEQEPEADDGHDRDDDGDMLMDDEELHFIAGQLGDLVEEEDQEPTKSTAEAEDVSKTKSPEPREPAEKEPAADKQKDDGKAEPSEKAKGKSKVVEPEPAEPEPESTKEKDQQQQQQPSQPQSRPEAQAQPQSQTQAQTQPQQPQQPQVPKPEPKKIKLAYSPNKALMLLQSLPLLDNLSSQIINLICRTTFEEMVSMLTDPESENAQMFHQLVELFEATKRLFTPEGFIPSNPIYQICRTDPQKIVLQRANAAVFTCAVLGATQVGFTDLNDYFMDAFVPPSGRLYKNLGTLYLDLKTQAYISSLRQKDDLDRPLEDILRDLFPTDIESELAKRRAAQTKNLTAHETGFADRCRNRYDFLKDKTSPDELAEEYSWMAFLRNLYDYLTKNIDTMASKHSLLIPEPAKQLSSAAKSTKPETVTHKKAGTYHVWNLAAADRKGKVNSVMRPRSSFTNDSKPAETEYQPSAAATAAAPAPAPVPAPVVRHTPTHSAQIAATAVVQTTSKQYYRHTWSKEEEAALLQGISHVEGPYWSQILEMYGPGGSVSEVLKNRTQVQLKDKARNLKIYYQKHELELPLALTYLTGENRRGAGRKYSPAPRPRSVATFAHTTPAVASIVPQHQHQHPEQNYMITVAQQHQNNTAIDPSLSSTMATVTTTSTSGSNNDFAVHATAGVAESTSTSVKEEVATHHEPVMATDNVDPALHNMSAGAEAQQQEQRANDEEDDDQQLEDLMQSVAGLIGD